MTSVQRLSGHRPRFGFQRHGKDPASGSATVASYRRIVDDICIIKSMHTEAVNHDPAITFHPTGSQQPGRPSLGAWASYGWAPKRRTCPPSSS